VRDTRDVAQGPSLSELWSSQQSRDCDPDCGVGRGDPAEGLDLQLGSLQRMSGWQSSD
jgi:hypothetical protein